MKLMGAAMVQTFGSQSQLGFRKRITDFDKLTQPGVYHRLIVHSEPRRFLSLGRPHGLLHIWPPIVVVHPVHSKLPTEADVQLR